MTRKTIVFMDMEHIAKMDFEKSLADSQIVIILTPAQAAFLKKDQSDKVVANNKWCEQNGINIMIKRGKKGGDKEFIASCLSEMKDNSVIVFNKDIPLVLIREKYQSKKYPYNSNDVCACSSVQPQAGVKYVLEKFGYRLIRGIKTTIFRTKYNDYGDRYVYPLSVMEDEPRWITL